MKYSIILTFFFVIGLLLAYAGYFPEFLLENDFSSYVLYLLMFVVGISIGGDKESLNILKQINWKIILVPLSVIVGSLLGTALYAQLSSQLTTKEAMAVGAGFGYYSLSSVLISEMYNKTLGTTALVANIIRELFTLLFSPFLVYVFGKLAPIASGGATSMDSTLPVITKYSGKDYVVISIFNGIVLTIIVPFLVSFIISF